MRGILFGIGIDLDFCARHPWRDINVGGPTARRPLASRANLSSVKALVILDRRSQENAHTMSATIGGATHEEDRALHWRSHADPAGIT